MIRTLLIDDEPLASDLVEEYLQKYPQFTVIGRCLNGFEGFKAINEQQPDLIFLDVQMPKINGFELLEMLESPPAVIFTTAFDAFALKAFEANALDYLLKPFSEDRFARALEKFLSRREKGEKQELDAPTAIPELRNQNRIVVKDGGKIRLIPTAEIIRLEADGDYVKIISTQGNFMQKRTLHHFESSLPDSVFARIHRTHLVNVSQIIRIDPYGKNNHLAQLRDGSAVPISRNGYQLLKQVLNL